MVKRTKVSYLRQHHRNQVQRAGDAEEEDWARVREQEYPEQVAGEAIKEALDKRVKYANEPTPVMLHSQHKPTKHGGGHGFKNLSGAVNLAKHPMVAKTAKFALDCADDPNCNARARHVGQSAINIAKRAPSIFKAYKKGGLSGAFAEFTKGGTQSDLKSALKTGFELYANPYKKTNLKSQYLKKYRKK